MFLKQFDLFPKVQIDFVTRNSVGGAVTLIAATFITFLVVTQFFEYLTPQYIPEISVDTAHRTSKIPIHFDISIHNVNCDFLTIDVIDHFSDKIGGAAQAVTRTPIPSPLAQEKAAAASLSPLPKDYCGSCYGAQTVVGQCCNSCEDVKKAYMAKRWAFLHTSSMEQCVREGAVVEVRKVTNMGCRVKGQVDVSRVRGSFHIAPGQSYESSAGHVHDLGLVGIKDLNVTHDIHSLVVGEPQANRKMGLDAPLDNTRRVDGAAGLCQRYFLQIVPTDMVSGAAPTETYQYSVTESGSPADGRRSMPGVFFSYDFSPMRVTVRKERESFLRYVTIVCGIVGGVISVSSALTAFFTGGVRLIQKQRLGKAL